MLTYKTLKILTSNFLFMGGIVCSVITPSLAANLPATIFPLDNYNQNVDTWLSPTAPDYNTPLISPEFQQQRMQELYQHLFSTADDAMSPWSANFINSILQQHPGLAESQSAAILEFSNRDKEGEKLNYGENFRPYAPDWIDKIANNMPVNYLSKFSADQRAIMVKNASMRNLPTDEVSFYSYQIPGAGYPFDNLQASQIWAGTPVYILAYTKDQRWAFIASSGALGWIESDKLGKVDAQFIARWQKAAQLNLIAITQTQIPVLSVENKAYQFSGYIGALFPLQATANNNYKILIPFRTITGQARIQSALISQQYAAKMPLSATRANFAKLLNNLKNRPYGWGGMYAYNDCSAEMQSLFLPFGIWLPRSSSQQAYMGKFQDETQATPEQRIAYLRDHGHPLMTIVYIGGHVFLYVGNYPHKTSTAPSATAVMIYQSAWGLRPADNSNRAIIGQSLFIPLWLSYPEDPKLQSWAAKSYFIVSNLDEMPTTPINLPVLFFSNLELPAAVTKSANPSAAATDPNAVDLGRQ